MKKIILSITGLLLLFGLIGCADPIETFDVDQFLKEAAKQITLPTTVSNHMALPQSMTYLDKVITLSWSSDQPEIISAEGQVIRPHYDDTDAVVTLTVMLTYETATSPRTFSITVTKLPEPDMYTVQFNTLGGSLLPAVQVKDQEKLIAPANPTRYGYTFTGWHKDHPTQPSYDFESTVSGDFILYANWTKVESTLDYLDIFYLNDLHGSIEPGNGDLGLAYIANYVNFHRKTNPNGVVLLAGGDMFQGSALSNYYMGSSTLNIMNAMDFDAMTLGNHEFDWGLEQVTQYFDQDYTNGEANFPLLGANVFYHNSTTIVEHIEPYTIIERGQVKIGIIGTMGYGLESSIAQSRINGYQFASPVSYIGQYAAHLRTVENVDYVLAVTHDSGEFLNYDVSRLSGNQKVDILFNAHSHRRYVEQSNGMHIIQSGSNGKYIGNIRIDLKQNSISLKNVNDHSSLYTADTSVQSLIDLYKAETDVLFNTPIMRTSRSISSTTLSDWVADLMRKTTNADIAFHNYGGTRDGLLANEDITLGKLYKIFPFDNTIKTVYLDGAQIRSFMNVSGNTYSSTISNFQNGTKYKVATNDYLFDKLEYPFVNGENPSFDGTLLRDMVVAELNRQKQVYATFDTTNNILVPLSFINTRSFLYLHF